MSNIKLKIDSWEMHRFRLQGIARIMLPDGLQTPFTVDTSELDNPHGTVKLWYTKGYRDSVYDARKKLVIGNVRETPKRAIELPTGRKSVKIDREEEGRNYLKVVNG